MLTLVLLKSEKFLCFLNDSGYKDDDPVALNQHHDVEATQGLSEMGVFFKADYNRVWMRGVRTSLKVLHSDSLSDCSPIVTSCH